MACYNDTVNQSWGWALNEGILALEWWKLFFHVQLKNMWQTFCQLTKTYTRLVKQH